MSESSSARVNAVSVNAAASVEVVPASSDREGILVFNDSSQVLYLRFGTGAASASDCSLKLAAGDIFSIESSYHGAIQGVWAGADASGKARVTELI